MERFAKCFGLVAALGLMLASGQAQAQTVINLVQGNSDLASLNPGPYATITLTQSGSNVIVDVKADNITSTGLTTTTPASISDFGFTLPSGATIDTTTATTSPPVHPPNSGVGGFPPFSFTTNEKFDGFGTYANAVTGGSNNNRVTEIKFTVDNTTVGAFGTNFAVKWYSNFDPGENQLTGFASHGVAVPEPGPLLGAGLVTLMGLGYTWRRRRRATA